MGVPKFYRWLSERYACLSQVIKDHQIPEFDNLYLDMNGIIHPCSHPNDDDPHFRISEEDIFLNIFHYIEVLFRIIKPQKVFFMAVDGVAPRAKMNQQRGRRFRSAKEAENNIRKALQKGEVLPTEERFDSNCITPGTEFMVRLQEQLKQLVNKKITTDPGWKEIKIYLSGHETPGEGEHKIMDFIRYERSQPGYDPNTRHCLYGLDADLIMLGLTSHDPHFSLLREEIRFGKNVKRVNNPEDITFHLLHLSLLREYIDWEFESLKTKISFEYDLEKIIDDWILMGFLVGNDFVPNLPNFHINHDALPYLWQVYKDVMPTLDGYLHDGGLLCLPNFECYLKSISKFDLEKFEDAYVDLKWLEGKLGASNEQESSDVFEEDQVDSSCKAFEKIAIGSACGSAKKSSKLRDYLEEKGVLKEAEEEDDGDFSNEHEKYKLRYYVEKFELTENDNCREFIKTLSLKYVEAIQWILHYYFNGVPSWGWFFTYHYAPYVSDIKDFKDKTFPFEIGKPFLPFEQLLAVLPAASKILLPEPFRNLMIMEQSAIIDYYPLEFKTDLNGKRQDWEAVVLIPFIDEKRLLAVMEPLYSRLNKGEQNRNRHSPCMVYETKKSENNTSPSPGTSPDLEFWQTRSEVIPIDKYRLSPEQITKGLLSDVKLDIYSPGFPTLKHVQHTGEMKKVGVKVFQMHSRGESMVLTIDESEEPDLKELAESMLGKPCYVGWPHLIEAFVATVSDGKRKFHIAKQDAERNIKEVTLNASDISVWKKQSSCEKQSYLEKKAVDVGMIHVLVEACQIQGKKYDCATKGAVRLEKIWSEWAVTFPLQVTVNNIGASDETDAGAVCSNITDLFPVGTECFMMAVPHYGSSGKVIEVDVKQNRIRVQLTIVPEPDLLSLFLNQDTLADAYMPAHVMCKRLGVSSQVLAQITGKVFVANGNKEGSSKVDIGLNLKFSKQNKEVLGYARRNEKWNFSPKTERVVSMYQEKFPEVFDALSKSSSQEQYTVSDVFPDAEPVKSLSDVKNWLKTLPCHNQTAVPCGSSTLDEPILKEIEETVEKLKGEKQIKKNVKVRVKPTVLYRPMKHMGQVTPDPAAHFELFDRVVNIRTLGVAPYGAKGTVVGIHQGKTEKDEKSYEVLFDESFLGGQSMRAISNRFLHLHHATGLARQHSVPDRGTFENKLFVVQAWSLLNLSYGARVEAKKKGLPSPRPQQPRPGQPLPGSPADYRPSGKASSRNMYQAIGAWQSPLNTTSPSPRHTSTPTRPSPEYRFPSPRFNSPFSQRPQKSPQRNSPRKLTPGFRPRLLLNPQTSPHGNNRSPNSHQSPDSRKASDTAENSSSALSAKESERVIRELLQMDNPPNGNRTTTSPQAIFNNPYQSSPISPMSPTSPASPVTPSGMLVLACRQNRWPNPGFSHHRTPQGLISTVCAAGKLFQGRPSSTIVESTESAASVALASCGLLPQSFPFLSPRMNNTGLHSFPSPASLPFTPPSQPLDSPVTRHQRHAQPQQPKRHHNVEKEEHRDNSPQTTTRVSAENNKSSGSLRNTPSSGSPRNTPSSTEVKIETKSNRSGGQRKELFIPHQVSLKNKDVPSVSKSKVEEAKREKPAEPEQNEASPKPPENEATPKGAKTEPRKAAPKLLAPSFFSAPPPPKE